MVFSAQGSIFALAGPAQNICYSIFPTNIINISVDALPWRTVTCFSEKTIPPFLGKSIANLSNPWQIIIQRIALWRLI